MPPDILEPGQVAGISKLIDDDDLTAPADALTDKLAADKSGPAGN
jgi:hypothetical protein